MDLGKLFEVHPEIVDLTLSEQIFPRNLSVGVSGHATEHATQRGLHAFGNLILRRPERYGVDESALFVTISKFEVVEKTAVRRKLSRTCSRLRRFLPIPGIRPSDLY